jgi:hypothetical protein
MRQAATAVVVIASVLAASGCASSGKKPTTSVRQTALGSAEASTLTRHEVQVARASDRHLSIFPAVPGKRRCSFPEGGTRITRHVIHAMCSTSIRLRHTYGEPSWIVTMTERWGHVGSCPANGYCLVPFKRHATWRVIEGETPTNTIRVLTTRISGAIPPQLYK